ncbi:MAG TPA: hypothetical protein VFC73_03335 [Syntrophomonadaceae bacterium]|nr:hypothetical protein [Syntrophomonadaceae bacterium]
MLKPVTVKFRAQMLEQIKFLAAKRGETISDTIRHLVSRGMTEKILEDKAEFIAVVIKAEIENVWREYQNYLCLDDVEHPDNIYTERLVLYRANKDASMPN